MRWSRTRVFRAWVALYLQRRRRSRLAEDVPSEEPVKVEIGKMALLKLDSTEKYIERNAVVIARLKNATETIVEFLLGQSVTIDETYANVKLALENPAYIPIWSELADIPGLANQSLDPRQVAAVIEKNATSCFLYMKDGRRLTINQTSAAVATALGYV